MALLHSSLRLSSVCRFVRYRSAFFCTRRIALVFSSCSFCTFSSSPVILAISAVSSSIFASDARRQR